MAQVLTAVQNEMCTVLDGVPTHFIIYLNLPEMSSYDLEVLIKGSIGAGPIPDKALRYWDEIYLSKLHHKGQNVFTFRLNVETRLQTSAILLGL